MNISRCLLLLYNFCSSLLNVIVFIVSTCLSCVTSLTLLLQVTRSEASSLQLCPGILRVRKSFLTQSSQRFFGLHRSRLPSCSSPKTICWGTLPSSILLRWPVQQRRLILMISSSWSILDLERTSSFDTYSCHLIFRMDLKHFKRKVLSLVLWQLWRVQVSDEYKRLLRTTVS